MLKVIAAFLAPFVLSLFFGLYNLVNLMITYNGSLTFSIDGLLFVYIYALPAYLFIAVPASIAIEYINKGIRWVNYTLAGLIGGLIVVFLNTNSTQGFVFPVEYAVVYMIAGFSFYVTLKLLEMLEDKLQREDIEGR
jgi:hypothetical protein